MVHARYSLKHRRRGRSLPAAAAVLVVLSPTWACSPDLRIPLAAQIECAEERPCPDGFLCSPVGRCEPSAALDREPPALAEEPAPAPSITGIGAVIRLGLRPTEPLLEPPEVTLDLGDRTGVFEREPGAETAADAEVRYSYRVTGGEPEGPREGTVRLVDTAGNEARETFSVERACPRDG